MSPLFPPPHYLAHTHLNTYIQVLSSKRYPAIVPCHLLLDHPSICIPYAPSYPCLFSTPYSPEHFSPSPASLAPPAPSLLSTPYQIWCYNIKYIYYQLLNEYYIE